MLQSCYLRRSIGKKLNIAIREIFYHTSAIPLDCLSSKELNLPYSYNIILHRCKTHLIVINKVNPKYILDYKHLEKAWVT